MSDHFIGEIMPAAFDFTPQDFVPCDGRLLPIQYYRDLFIVLGTTYGGDGKSDFGVPDLRDRVPLHSVEDSEFALGRTGGDATVTLRESEMPQHGHTLYSGIVTPANPTQVSRSPITGAFTTTSAPDPFYAVGSSTPVEMSDAALASTGGGGAHENRQPFLTINYVIATTGVFPLR